LQHILKTSKEKEKGGHNLVTCFFKQKGILAKNWSHKNQFFAKRKGPTHTRLRGTRHYITMCYSLVFW
jgi:hypothetical protein